MPRKRDAQPWKQVWASDTIGKYFPSLPTKVRVKIQNKNGETYAIDSMNPNMQSQPKDGDNVNE